MKVLHLATGKNGGAYQAAVRLNDLLVKNGVNSKIISSANQKRHHKILSKIITLIDQSLTHREYGIMSVLSLNGLTHRRITDIKPDIIHIHNWFNLLSINGISKLSSIAPVVVTLHDERLITGGCHNHLNCTEIANACSDCPALTIPVYNLVSKSRIASNNVLKNKKINVVVPSNWMSTSIHDYVSRDINIHVIPNPVQEAFYDERISAKQDTKTNGIRIGFIAANPWVELKGLKRLLESLSAINKLQDRKFTLEIVGAVDSREKLPSFAQAVGIKSTEQIVEFLDQIDFLVISSFSENYPNIITEAQLRGTVVVSTNVGGIPEMIVDEFTGFLQQEDEDIQALLQRALKTELNKLNEIGRNGREQSLTRHSQDYIFSEITSVYKRAIANGK